MVREFFPTKVFPEVVNHITLVEMHLPCTKTLFPYFTILSYEMD